jgi:hypothetical protein
VFSTTPCHVLFAARCLNRKNADVIASLVTQYPVTDRRRVHLKRATIRGFRASGRAPIVCELPGRFAVLLGANNAGKTTLADALYLSHPHAFPQLGRPSVARSASRLHARSKLSTRLPTPASQKAAWETRCSRKDYRRHNGGGISSAASAASAQHRSARPLRVPTRSA